MKILYGVQGTGNGHTTRARIMAKAFAKTDIQVDWVFSGRPENEYFDMEIFGDYKVFRGMTFAIDDGRVDFAKTLVTNNLFKVWQEVKTLDASGYDLAIIDFEPVTGWAAKRAGIKTIGLSHQCAFSHDIPKLGSNPVTDLFMRWFAPVQESVGLHWHHFDQDILPPIIETEYELDHQAPALTQQESSYYVLYNPFMELATKLELLEPLTGYKFYVYHGVDEPIDKGHIKVMPYSREGFQKHLLGCAGVISSCGFELPSEAIHLGKKLMVMPLKGQVEQLSNGLALDQLNLATVEPNMTSDKILSWLEQGKARPRPFPNVAKTFVEWLEANQEESFSSLKDRLWQSVESAEVSLGREMEVESA